MKPNDEEVSEEFKDKVEQFLKGFLNYEELSPENKALYDIIADICDEEEENET
ncbi:hypothetical protein [Salinibacillus xinjiangensis]|uniref:Uncharacterized protein n=1 Tax=Salinibacillus xinjiangensis TaxID=1229268 RepID=A0A6G1X705_9BACI|nr:hypothetical protein [Salinibacillus xinjiangensis]MRG86709.1 hypothetical protein [Salinibacillus xinjiangensis]